MSEIEFNSLKTVVIDNGSGYTKMGYAGNPVPSFNIPTVISDHIDKGTVQISKMQNDNLDFFIGNEAFEHSSTHQIYNPISSGVIKDWELMEKFWHRSIYDYLRCEPEEHVFILTEPPMNPPENREQIAEIFFETFNAKGLYIGVQAVLALLSHYYNTGKKDSLTGTVLDSGDGVTHVIPIADGYVIGSCIKHIPLAGRDITNFFMNMLRDRGENIPPEEIKSVAKEVKEKYSVISSNGDLIKLYKNYDEELKIAEKGVHPHKYFKQYSWKSKHNGKDYNIDVGYERFLGPEMFYKPEFLDSKYRMPIDEVIDNAIQSCPIDTRRKLYQNIILSGGSTLVKNFHKRLQKEIEKRTSERIKRYEESSGVQIEKMKVNVAHHKDQKYSVWVGGSYVASEPRFSTSYHTRERYFEEGPSIARHNPVCFGGM